jgi:hypothetical protein
MINMLNVRSSFGVCRSHYIPALTIESFQIQFFIRLALKINVAFLNVYVFKSRINIWNLISLTCKFRQHVCIIHKAAQSTEKRAILGKILFSVL